MNETVEGQITGHDVRCTCGAKVGVVGERGMEIRCRCGRTVRVDIQLRKLALMEKLMDAIVAL